MDRGDEIGRPGSYTLRRLAHVLGLSPENVRALEKRGRLPEGCEPAIDEISGTRYWTADQVKRLKEWNDERPNRPVIEEMEPDEQ